MIHEGKEYILTEGDPDVPCKGCPLTDLCDQLADDYNMIEFELCATEEDFGEFGNPIYKKKEDETNSDR